MMTGYQHFHPVFMSEILHKLCQPQLIQPPLSVFKTGNSPRHFRHVLCEAYETHREDPSDIPHYGLQIEMTYLGRKK